MLACARTTSWGQVPDRARPGKNLVAVYTFEAAGLDLTIRFETGRCAIAFRTRRIRQGRPQSAPTRAHAAPVVSRPEATSRSDS